jgi:sulfite exporter TauE/SafE
MSPVLALIYSFLLGLLHGILPDEHTWPITFSYAIGSGSGRQGMKAALFFSVAFTVQRTILSELSYLALARFLVRPSLDGYVYVIVGLAMSIAGGIVVRRNWYAHLHLLGHHHDTCGTTDRPEQLVAGVHDPRPQSVMVPPVAWTLVHGFIAGFGVGAFSLFINTVAAPAMGSPWTAFLPGLLFGIGTTLMLLVIGGLFGMSLKWIHSITEDQLRRIGAQTGGRTLFFGGLLFVLAGFATILGWDRWLPVDAGYFLIALFMTTVVVPAFVYSWKEVLAARN